MVFTDPQIILAGQNFAQLTVAATHFAVGEVPFEDQGRSRAILKNQGALRLYAEYGSARLLGAEMIGPAAEHLGHLLSWSVQRGDSVQQMLGSPFCHLVIEEGLRTGLRSLRDALQRLPAVPAPQSERCLDCAPVAKAWQTGGSSSVDCRVGAQAINRQVEKGPHAVCGVATFTMKHMHRQCRWFVITEHDL